MTSAATHPRVRGYGGDPDPSPSPGPVPSPPLWCVSERVSASFPSCVQAPDRLSRSSYRVVSKTSNVDESLFGSTKPGAKTGGKSQVRAAPRPCPPSRTAAPPPCEARPRVRSSGSSDAATRSSTLSNSILTSGSQSPISPYEEEEEVEEARSRPGPLGFGSMSLRQPTTSLGGTGKQATHPPHAL